jgi:Holliday junction resolvase-like predicted endonuclease
LEYLEERGYTLVERDHRTRHGEIDLVMCDQETLVLIPSTQRDHPSLRFHALLSEGISTAACNDVEP